jgi:mono/diheme cytochrome c family protein
MKTLKAVILFVTLAVGMPFAADMKAGQAAYDRSCKSCHGTAGAPNAAVAKMMKIDMKDLGSADVQSQSDAELKKIITEGKGKMKPVKTISAADVDDVLAYVRTFKK